LLFTGDIHEGRKFLKGFLATPVPAPVAQPRRPGQALSEETAGVLNKASSTD
jgi:glutathione-regulated potassium-efflux system protein KefB